MNEKRKFLRIPENLEISYRHVSQAKAANFLTKDISQGGLRFFTHEFISPESLLKVKLNLSQVELAFEALVKVKWAKNALVGERYEVGAEFIDIPPQALKRLIHYIEGTQKSHEQAIDKREEKNE